MSFESLQYPIGKYQKPSKISKIELENWIHTIKEFPEKINSLVANLPEETLTWRYRPDGWNIAQVVHHLADSHINSYTRFRLGITEKSPVLIRPYMEAIWAELPDSRDEKEVASSLAILTGLHRRWYLMLKAMDSEDFECVITNPQQQRSIVLDELLAQYDWHCRHHLAHIENALKYRGAFD